ncbi:MAG: adenylate/guanylate cyclase domain-containing protein [Kofleriaceae bacterium]|nr:adenylate/guanylate cyclase domain-containing protein [Kofleriaceae bacterium]MCB9574832.1 adenylate/guanylate cyclase domain-containing protein [Kofleriaceae bacterium]
MTDDGRDPARALVPGETWDVATLLAAHPWPAAFADARRLEWLWHVDVDLAPDRLWPLISDVSRLNRALGNPPMQFVERDGQRWGRGRYGGVLHEWLEVPWNWLAGRWFELTRIYQRGGMRALYGVHLLEPRGAGTRLHVYWGVVSRARILELPIRLSFAKMGRAYRRVVPCLAAEVARADAARAGLDAVALYHPPAPALPAAAAARLARLGDQLVADGVDATTVRRLVDWVRTADDLDLERIRSRERARAWGLDEDDVLRACLHATRAGMLELTWDVVCPHCRGVRDATARLGELPGRGACAACGIEFGTDADDTVEISFHVHPSIRTIERRTYCSAEPANKPHIVLQQAVAAGAAVDVDVPDEAGRYRIRLRGATAHGALEVGPDGDGEARWSADGPPARLAVAPRGRLRLENPAGEAHTFAIEAAAALDVALRPGRLLSFQDFRDLFSEEYLGTDIQLAVGEQTILFTDVVGSTAMYAERGDPAAFVEVKRHFDEVFRIIGAHRGAVVKTIGDAAMGAFNDPLDAVRAAAAIHAAFPPGRGAAAIRLRISINTGPCIAVRLNAAIDYFGNAVNVAAKLQAAAEAWQVAVSEATLAAPGVAAWLAGQGAALEDVDLDVKGLVETVRARRWTVLREPG